MSDTASSNPEVGYSVLDKQKSRRAYALSPDQRWWLAIWMTPTLIIGIQWFFEDLRPLAILPFAMCIGAWKTSRGIIFRNIQADAEDYYLRKRKGVIYDGKPRKKAPLGLKVVSFESHVDSDELIQLAGEGLDAEQLQTIIDNSPSRSFSIGTIYSSRERTDTAYISGTGLKGSNGDPAELFARRSAVADGITRAIGLYPKPPSICMIYSRRPANVIPQLLQDHRNLDPKVQQARQLELKNMGRDDKGRELLDVDGFFTDTTVQERQKAALDLARAEMAVDGEEVTQLVAVSFKRPRYAGVKRGELPPSSKITHRQLRRMPIKRLAEEVAREMKGSGITGVQVLDRTDVNKVIRTGNDVANIQAWQQDLYDAAVEATKIGDPDPVVPPVWPKITSGRMKNGKIYAKIGDTYFMVKQVAGYTKSHFFADDLLALFDTSEPEFQPSKYTGLTISFCSDIINVQTETNILTRKRAFAAGWDRARNKGDEIETAQEVENRQALANKQNLLYYSGVYAMLYNVYVTVAAMTLEMLEDADESIDARGRSAGVKFRYFGNEMRHARSLITALYGVNMVNR